MILAKLIGKILIVYLLLTSLNISLEKEYWNGVFMKNQSKHYYIDKTGNVAIDVSDYLSASDFSEGLAAFCRNEGRCGYINTLGEIIIEAVFLEAHSFSDGMAIVKTREKTSFDSRNNIACIDKTGKVVFDLNYEVLYDFSEGIAIGRKGKELVFIDKTGAKLHEMNTDELDLECCGNQKFSEGLIVARDKKTNKCGYLDKSGRFLIEPKYNNASSFSEGLGRVSIEKNEIEYVGFIDHKGEFVIPPVFDIEFEFLNSTDFSEGLASIVDSESFADIDLRYIYINNTGVIVLRSDFFRAERFSDGLAVVYDAEKDKYGYISKNGKLEIPTIYDFANDFSEGLARVVVNE